MRNLSENDTTSRTDCCTAFFDLCARFWLTAIDSRHLYLIIIHDASLKLLGGMSVRRAASNHLANPMEVRENIKSAIYERWRVLGGEIDNLDGGL
jgi:hypothetical protein